MYAGPEIRRNERTSKYVLKKKVIIIPKIMNSIPPIFSCFQENTSNPIRINVGMLCMMKPRSNSQPVYSPNTSKENNMKNTIKRREITLGVQYRYLFVLLIFLIDFFMNVSYIYRF